MYILGERTVKIIILVAADNHHTEDKIGPRIVTPSGVPPTQFNKAHLRRPCEVPRVLSRGVGVSHIDSSFFGSDATFLHEGAPSGVACGNAALSI